MKARFLILPIASLAAGCVSLGGGKVPATLMTLTPDVTSPAGTDRTARQGQAVSILVPTTPQSLATVRVPVQTSPTGVAYLKDAQWSEAPARLFRNLLAETVGARTGRVVLDLRQFGVAPGLVLSGRINRFGYDATSRSVVVSYDGVLKRGDAVELDTKRFEAKVSSSDGPQAIASALNQAANQVADQVADWMK